MTAQIVRLVPSGRIVRLGGAGGSHPRPWEPGMPAGGLVGPDSVFAADVTSATVDAESADKLSYFIAQNLTPYFGGVAAFNVTQYNTAMYTVNGGVTPSTLGFRDEQGKGNVPSQLYKAASGEHFAGWPITDDMVPASGNDGHLAIYDLSTDTLYSAWRAKLNATKGTYSAVRGVTAADAGPTATLSPSTIPFPGWSAVWGGRINGLLSGKGWFPSGMGTSASGLATELGSLGVVETQAALAAAGALSHALSLAIIKPRRSTYSYPAQRTDGPDSNPLALMEGQRVRLKASFNVAASSLTPLGKVVARTAQTRGFLVTDKAGTVNVATESGNPFAAVSGGANPWTAMMQGKASYEILKGFPWSQCEVIAPDWGKP